MSQKERIILPGGNVMPIRDFKFKWFCDSPTICMIAKRNSGKSWVCRCILKHFSYLPGGVIIAPTDRMSSFYGKFFWRTTKVYKRFVHVNVYHQYRMWIE